MKSKLVNFNLPIVNKLSKDNSIKFIKKLNQKNGNLVHGPNDQTFKIKHILKKKFQINNCHLTNSCTSALEICAILTKNKNKNEVLMPSYTFVSTGNSFARSGFNIRYCDINPNTLMPDFSHIKSKVSKKTCAIVIIHYQGFCVDYIFELKKFCKNNGIFLIEDAAQAFGSFFKNKHLGTIGDFGCYSFHHTKNIHSGIGGLISINNKKFIDKSFHVFDKGTDRNLVISGRKKKYGWVSLGSSFLMSELHASFLLPQIANYKQIINQRKKLYSKYLEKLDEENFNKKFFLVKKNIKNYNYHALVLVLKFNKRSKFLNFLSKNKIFAYVGYSPLHQSKYGKKFLKSDKLHLTDNISNKIVRLPMHYNMNEKDVDYVSKKIKYFFSKN